MTSFQEKIYNEIVYIVNKMHNELGCAENGNEGYIFNDSIESIDDYKDILVKHIESEYTRNTPTSERLIEKFATVNLIGVYNAHFRKKRELLKAVEFIALSIYETKEQAKEWSEMYFAQFLDPDRVDSNSKKKDKTVEILSRLSDLEEKVNAILSILLERGGSVKKDTITEGLNFKFSKVRVSGKEYKTLQEYFNSEKIESLDQSDREIINHLNRCVKDFPDRTDVYFTNNSKKVKLILKEI